MLKGSKKLLLSVRSVGRIPGGYVTNHVYTWVDPQGRSVSPPPDLPEHCSATVKRTESQRRSNMQLLQEGDEKKVREQSGVGGFGGGRAEEPLILLKYLPCRTKF